MRAVSSCAATEIDWSGRALVGMVGGMEGACASFGCTSDVGDGFSEAGAGVSRGARGFQAGLARDVFTEADI